MIDREDTSGDATASATDPTGALPPLPPPSMPDALPLEAASIPPLDDLPYLPPATPPVVSAPPVLIGVERVVARRHATSPRRARHRVAVAAGVLLVAGAAAVPIVAGYVRDSSTAAPSAEGPGANPSAPTTPLVTAPASSLPPTIATPATSPSTIPTTVAPPQAIIVHPGGTEEYFALVERCRTEQRIVFASLQAFMNTTGATPDSPDSLVDIGWLEPHPEGWSPRWAFQGIDGAIYVVPVPGGDCDV